MQQTSQLYKSLLAAGAPKEVRVRFLQQGSTPYYRTYGQDMIISATTRASMMPYSLGIGNCIAKELHLVMRDPVIIGSGPVNDTLYPPDQYSIYFYYVDADSGAWWVCWGNEWHRGDGIYDPAINSPVPRMARTEMSYRLVGGENPWEQSEWIPKGTFFVDTRDSANGVLTLDAYDAMLKAEQYLSQDPADWPKTDIEVVQAVAALMQVAIDPRTLQIVTQEYLINFPGRGDEAYTAREVLGYIGVMYGGNWIVTDENKLRLIVLGDIPSSDTNYLIDEYGSYIVMGGDRIIVSR